MTPDTPTSPTDAFAELALIKFSEVPFDGVLSQVVGLARRTVPPAGEVSMTLVGVRGAYSAAYTGKLALTLDEWQYEQDDGPCLVAAATVTTVTVPDIRAERRWRPWAERAAEVGVRSSLSIGLPLHESVSGSLNLYAFARDAFDADAVAASQRFARVAAVATANAHQYDKQANMAQHMRVAMQSRAVIEQAKGIIMAERRCTPDEAFVILSKLSQDANRKLRDVAAALVARASGPPDPRRPADV